MRGEKDSGEKSRGPGGVTARSRHRLGPGMRLLLGVMAGLVLVAVGLLALDALLPGNGPADGL